MTGQANDTGPRRPEAAQARARGRGRPEVFTPDQHDRYLQAIAAGATQQKAAADLGISPRTVRHHTAYDKEFAQALEEAKVRGRDARIPHGATRYRVLGCRCTDICVPAATAARIERRNRSRQHTYELDRLPDNGAQIHHLPAPRAEAPPLAAGF